WRIDHRFRDACSLYSILCAGHINRDELGGAFTAASKLARQVLAYLQKPCLELPLVYRASKAVRHQNNGVASTRIGIDAHGIEGSIDDSFEHRTKRCCGQLRVCHQIR